jgi:sugar transferase (PEP-CTERM/EpsH1 system associated)
MKRKARIVHVLHSFGTGGMENGVVNLINGLDSNEFSHIICCVSQSGDAIRRLNGQNVKIIELRKKTGNDLFLPMKISRILKEIRPDVVHTRNWGAVDGIIGAYISRVPGIVHSEHGREFSDPEGRNKRRNIIRKGLSLFVDKYIAVSENLRQWLIRDVGIRKAKITTIINGVDTERFNTRDKRQLRYKYGYEDEDFILGTVGRLDPIKDHHLLIKAYAGLYRKYRKIKLIIVGDGPCRQRLEVTTKTLGMKGNVHFLGKREDVPDILKLFDVFALSSIGEGLSNTILEAMATGIPVIATHVGGNSELVANGETGNLVPQGDIDRFAQALEQYILDKELAKKHGENGRLRVVSHFSLEKMVESYRKVYCDLLASGNAV